MKKLVIIFLFCILLTSSVSAYHIFYYHNDHLGNPVAITNENGEVVWKANYEPFGEIFNEEEIEIGNKFGYNTKELNKNTNLLYYGARYYDPGIGRFTTADTVKGSLSAPQSLNRYSYVLNNPLKYIDLKGNEPKIKDKGWEYLYRLAHINVDTLITGEDIGVLNTELPFNDLDSIEKKGNNFDIQIKSSEDIYKTGIPKYKISGVPKFISDQLGNIIGHVEVSKNFVFEKTTNSIPYLNTNPVTFRVISGSLKIDVVGVLNALNFDDATIQSLSIIESEETGKIYGLGLSYSFSNEGGSCYGGLFDLETNTIYNKDLFTKKGINYNKMIKKGIPLDVLKSVNSLIGEGWGIEQQKYLNQ